MQQETHYYKITNEKAFKLKGILRWFISLVDTFSGIILVVRYEGVGLC